MPQPMNNIELDAHAAWEIGELKLALKLFTSCAIQGCSACMLVLGYFYDAGLATTADKVLAMHWYKKAYRLGSSSAASNIAILYREQGQLNLTVQWWRRAVRLNDGDAEVELAKLLMEGSGIRKSFSKAKAHLLNALASSHITPAGIDQAKELLAQLQEQDRLCTQDVSNALNIDAT